MADYGSSLPIRTENNGDVVSRISDGTITSQLLTVNADGSVNITDNNGSLTVDANNLDIRDLAFATDKVDVSGSSVIVSSTDLDIRDITHTQDSIKIGDGTDFLAVNADGSINSVVTATDLDIRDLAFATDKVDVSGSSVTVSATDLDIRNLAFATDKVDVSGSSVSATVTATDLDIRDLSHTQDSVKIGDGTDFLAVNADGSLNVVVTSSVAGDPVADYKDDSSIAAGASASHDYTVTAGKTFKLIGVLASASGMCKVEVKIETAAGSNVFNTKFVGFNSTATPNVQLYPSADIMVPAGARIRVTKTNRDKQAQDLYSTIEGSEL